MTGLEVVIAGAVWKAGLFVAEEGFKGWFANSADRAVQNTLEKLRQGAQSGLPENHDLQRITLEASLRSTRYLVGLRFGELGVESDSLKRRWHLELQRRAERPRVFSEVQWLDQVQEGTTQGLKKSNLQATVEAASEKATASPQKATQGRSAASATVDEIAGLLAGESEVALKTQAEKSGQGFEAISDRLLSQMLRELEETYGRVPEGFSALAQTEWVQSFYAYWVHHLKQNEDVQAYLEGKLLAKIWDGQNRLALDFNTLGGKLANQLSDIQEELQRLRTEQREHFEQISIDIDEILTQVASQSETLDNVEDLLRSALREARRRPLYEAFVGTEVFQATKERLIELTDVFVGREDDLRGLDRVVSAPDRASETVVVTAPAGSGKSALLAHWLTTRQTEGVRPGDHRSIQPFFAYHFFGGANPRTRETTRRLVPALQQILRQLYAYYQEEGERLPTTEIELRDAIYGLLTNRGARAQEEPLVVVLDALDEAERGLDPFIFTGLPEGIYVVASTRTASPSRRWAYPSHSQQWLDLHLRRLEIEPDLGKGSVRNWIEEEADREKEAGRSIAADVLLGLAGDEVFVNRIEERTDRYPLYLSFLIRQLAEIASNGAEEVQEAVHQLPGGFQEYIERELSKVEDDPEVKRSQGGLQLLAVLAAAVGPLGQQDVETVTARLLASSTAPSGSITSGITARAIRQLSSSVKRWISVSGEHSDVQYGLAHPKLSNAFRDTYVLHDDVDQAEQELIAYCMKWDEHRSSYALQDLPEHLELLSNRSGNEAASYRPMLYNLASDTQYANAQRQQYPDRPALPRLAPSAALRVAIRDENPPAIAASLLHYALRTTITQKRSPLDYFREGLTETALESADLYEPTEQLLYHLLVAWACADRSQVGDAERVLTRLIEKSPLLSRQYDAAMLLLDRVAPAFPELAVRIYEQAIRNGSWPSKGDDQLSLCATLAQHRHFEAALDLAQNISDGRLALRALSRLFDAISQNGKPHEKPSTADGKPLADTTAGLRNRVIKLAREIFQRATEIDERLWCQLEMAKLLGHRDSTEALRLTRKCVADIQRSDRVWTVHKVRMLVAASNALYVLGQTAEATSALHDAESLATQLSNPYQRVSVLAEIGRELHRQNQSTVAYQLGLEASRTALTIGGYQRRPNADQKWRDIAFLLALDNNIEETIQTISRLHREDWKTLPPSRQLWVPTIRRLLQPGLCYALLDHHRVAEAIDLSSKIPQDFRREEIHREATTVLAEKGNLRAAERLRDTLQSPLEYAKSSIGIAQAILAGRPKEAARFAQEADDMLASEPFFDGGYQESDLPIQIAEVFAAVSQHDKARLQLNKTFQKSALPEDLSLHSPTVFEIADSLARTGLHTEARALVADVESDGSASLWEEDYAEGMASIAAGLFNSDRVEEGRDVFDDFVDYIDALDLSEPDWLLSIFAETLASNGQPFEALQFCQKAGDRQIPSRVYSAIIVSYILQGKYDDALALTDRLTDWGEYHAAAQAFAEKERYTEAVQIARSAENIAHGPILLSVASEMTRKGSEMASETLDMAFQATDEKDYQTLKDMSAVFVAQGRDDEAQAALELIPDTEWVYRNEALLKMAYAYTQMGRYTNAEDCADQIIKWDKNEYTALILGHIAAFRSRTNHRTENAWRDLSRSFYHVRDTSAIRQSAILEEIATVLIRKAHDPIPLLGRVLAVLRTRSPSSVQHLIQIAAREGKKDIVLFLIPYVASDLEAARSVCASLIKLYPSHAREIYEGLEPFLLDADRLSRSD